jgi:hypothetical protein
MDSTSMATGNGIENDYILIIYRDGTDSGLAIRSGLAFGEADNIVCHEGLEEGDYAILRGTVVKGFVPEPTVEEPPWTIERVAELMDDEQSKYAKRHIAWPAGSGGGGESIWVRVPNDLTGIVIVGNTPLYPKYQFMDVVESSGDGLGQVLFRPYPVVVKYLYGVDDDEAVDEGNRKKLAEALQSLTKSLGFFSAGQGHADLPDEESIPVMIAALLDTDVPIIQVVRQHFDVLRDSQTYEHLHGRPLEDADEEE